MQWITRKNSRFVSLYQTSKYIRETKGLKALINRTLKFIKGERNNTAIPALFLIEQDKKLRDDDEIYNQWIIKNEPSAAVLTSQRKKQLKFKYRPLISILTPVYNTDVVMLEEMLKSILDQTYTNWELCIVDGASNVPHIKQILDKYSAQYDRVKITYLKNNYGISGNSNEALKLVSGEFTALVDHDDLLPANALYEIVRELNKFPELDFIYTDKDTISQDGKRRFNPLFKPDWSPDILFNANYLTHLNVIRTKILHDIGGFDSKTDGAQDWDLFIRISLQTDRISHIPMILYHWRFHEQSTSSGFQAKPYAIEGQLICVQKYLNRKALNAEVIFNNVGMPQIIWDTIPSVKVTIIIDVTGNSSNLNSLIKNCLSQSLYNNIEIIIINRSEKLLKVKNYVAKIVILNYPLDSPTGYAFEAAVQQSAGDVLIFIDSRLNIQNIELTIHELVSWTQYEEIGVVGGLVLNQHEKVESTGIILNKNGTIVSFGNNLHRLQGTFLGHLTWYRNFSALPQWFMAIRKSVVQQVGGFNTKLNTTANIDFCLRVSAKNLRIFYTPHAVLEFQQKNEKMSDLKDFDLKFITKQHKAFFQKTDPYSNPKVKFIDGISILQH